MATRSSPDHPLGDVVETFIRREDAERGHARPSMSLDVYSHVMPPNEVASERFLALIDA